MACAILGLIAGMSLPVLPVMYRAVVLSGYQAKATLLAQNAIELIRTDTDPYATAPLYHEFDTRFPVRDELPQRIKDRMTSWKNDVQSSGLKGWGVVTVEPYEDPGIQLVKVTATVHWEKNRPEATTLVTYVGRR